MDKLWERTYYIVRDGLILNQTTDFNEAKKLANKGCEIWNKGKKIYENN